MLNRFVMCCCTTFDCVSRRSFGRVYVLITIAFASFKVSKSHYTQRMGNRTEWQAGIIFESAAAAKTRFCALLYEYGLRTLLLLVACGVQIWFGAYIFVKFEWEWISNEWHWYFLFTYSATKHMPDQFPCYQQACRRRRGLSLFMRCLLCV